MHSCFIHRSHCWSFIYAYTKGNWNIFMLCAVVLFLRKTFGIRSKRIHIAQGCCGMAFWGTTLNSLTSNMTWFVAEEQKSWRNSRRCGQNMCLLLRVISYHCSFFSFFNHLLFKSAKPEIRKDNIRMSDLSRADWSRAMVGKGTDHSNNVMVVQFV